MKLTTLLTGVALVALGATGAEAQTVLKFGHVGEPGSLFETSALEFARCANEKLAGKAEVTPDFTRALLALQGPLAAAALARHAPEAGRLAFMTAAPMRVAGLDCGAPARLAAAHAGNGRRRSRRASADPSLRE